MELRSRSKKDQQSEYDEFRMTLSGLGFFEEGMELQEMRDIYKVLTLGTDEGDTSNEQSSNENVILNSTMLTDTQNRYLEPSTSSPINCQEIITIRADVHHAMDWSPTKSNNDSSENENTFRKRNTENAEGTIATKRVCLDSNEGEIIDSGIDLMNSNTNNYTPQSTDSGDKNVNLDYSFFGISSDESSNEKQTSANIVNIETENEEPALDVNETENEEPALDINVPIEDLPNEDLPIEDLPNEDLPIENSPIVCQPAAPSPADVDNIEEMQKTEDTDETENNLEASLSEITIDPAKEQEVAECLINLNRLPTEKNDELNSD